ncbi:MAG TPA: glutathione S-transferase family protein [Polyangiaceae bacterium]|nr:glutathione S-transferase family protein [Polyangiaceae bacterium]
MTSKPVLYDYLFSGNCYKIRLLLSQLGVAFETRPIDILAGEARQPSFLRKNPLGQVPVLELADGTCLRESSAILMHLAEGTALLPAPGLARTRVLEWLCFEQSNVAQVIGRARFRRTFPDAVPTRPEELEAWQRQGSRALRILEERLHDYTHLTDHGYTIADIALYAYTHSAPQAGISLEPYAAIRSWIERIEEMPGYLAIDQPPSSSAEASDATPLG